MGQRAKLATGGPRSPRSARAGLPLTLLLLLGLVPQRPAESPWGLPIVDDDAASMAKELIAQLANLKLEFKPWPGGTHSLHYHYLTLSEPGSNLPDFLAVGYVDDQPFIRYDSRLGKAKPQALWVAPIEAQYWEMETQKQRGWEKVQQVEIWTMMRYHNRSSEPPKVQVTKHLAQDGCAMLKCWALGFYPKDITLSWWLGGEELTLETEQVETRPSGDGTYQTWAVMHVCKGVAETQYTCHVQHPSLNSTLIVAWEPPSCCGPKAVIIITSLFIALLVAGIVFWKTWLQAKKKTSYKQAPGDCVMELAGGGNSKGGEDPQ
ncbi:DLA class I histocompatibility antigen, A9/A9 alpha chain-like isoform X3 [Choloepus didactylus]|uniref:DLA class I histocompatibility antigen, A9/A9 alpha chain-like isoform X3 n=1 Tax=Choloepus didactylus TaxID=27675 RepID=UPI0018A11FD9|nr:DLA class I histocompatibility antigen, A9/A9 alpha chain-like isoform X3 [Choloepus didactylus]